MSVKMDSDSVNLDSLCGWYRDLSLVEDRLTLNRQLIRIVRWGPRHIPNLCARLDADVLAYPSNLLWRSPPCIQSHVLELLTLVAQHLKSDPRMALYFAPRVCQNLYGYFAAMRNPLNQWHNKQHYDQFGILIGHVLTSLPLEQLLTCACFTWNGTCDAFSTVAEMENSCTHNDDNLRCINVYWYMMMEFLAADGHSLGLPGTPPRHDSTPNSPSVQRLDQTHQSHAPGGHITSKALYASLVCVARLARCSAFRSAAKHQAAHIIPILRHHISHRDDVVAAAAVQSLTAILYDEGHVPGLTDGLISQISPLVDVRSSSDLLAVQAMDLLFTQQQSPTFLQDMFHSGALGRMVHSVLSRHRVSMKYLAQVATLCRVFAAVDAWHVVPAMRLDLMAAVLMARRRARILYELSADHGAELTLGAQVVEVTARECLCMLHLLCQRLDRRHGRAAMRDARQQGSLRAEADIFHWDALPGESANGGLVRAWELSDLPPCTSLFARMIHRAQGVFPDAEDEVAAVVLEEREMALRARRGAATGRAVQAPMLEEVDARRSAKLATPDYVGHNDTWEHGHGQDGMSEPRRKSLRERFQVKSDLGEPTQIPQSGSGGSRSSLEDVGTQAVL